MTGHDNAALLPSPLIEGVPSVCVGAWSLSADDLKPLGCLQGRHIAVFGAKIPAPLQNYPDAWRMQYCLREVLESGEVFEHHLAQRESVMYCPEGCGQDPNECADMVRPADIPCLKVRPRWRRSDASIPMTAEGRLMTFVRQCISPPAFEDGYALFCFAAATGGQALHWKLFTQNMTEQTAEAHYQLEEQMAEFDRHWNNQAVVQRLIAAGDTYFQEYVLQHPRTTPEILEVLLKHAKTAAMRSAVRKKLSGA